MSSLNLTQLCVLLGLGYAALASLGIVKTDAFTLWLKSFHRNVPWGVAFILIGTAWFEYYLINEKLSDFAAYKNLLIGLFAVTGIGACFFLQDYLSIRGLAVLMLLTAKVMTETQRWHSSPWKNVVTLWAYVLAVLGMWWVISPWRARDWIAWNTATQSRLRLGSVLRIIFGLSVAALGATVLQASKP